MTNIHFLFLKILKTILSGDKLIETEELKCLLMDEWRELLKLAQTHKMLPIVYEGIYQLPCLQMSQTDFLQKAKGLVIQQVTLQTMKTAQFFQWNQFMREHGYKPLVVKGIVCGNLYPKSDYRLSSDEDVWMEPATFEKCHELMIKFGLSIMEEVSIKDSYEISYRKKDSPLYIELHKSLFPVKDSVCSQWNTFFEEAYNRAIKVDIQGELVYTLDYTDHLFYLICHAFKHFLHSGFGIRQVCDIVMFANSCGRWVNWRRIKENCLQIRAHVFAATLFQIGYKFLNFNPVQACYPDEFMLLAADESHMLEDLLCGGIYGAVDRSRKHSSNITLNVVAKDRKQRIQMSTNGRTAGKRKPRTYSLSAIIKTIFPPVKSLVGRYSYLKRRPYLLPFAWGKRIVRYGIEIAKETVKGKNNSAIEAVKIGNQRIALLKEYDVID